MEVDFVTLNNFVKKHTKSEKINFKEAQIRLVGNISNPRGEVVHISYGLYPRDYGSLISQELCKLLERCVQPVTFCWGPCTFFEVDKNGYTKNDLYQKGILESLDFKQLRLLHSKFRQGTSLWVFGERVMYEKPHGFDLGIDEREIYWANDVPGLPNLLNGLFDLGMNNGSSSSLRQLNNTKRDLEESFRSVYVSINDDGTLRSYRDISDVGEALKYFSSLVKRIPQVGFVMYDRPSHVNVRTHIDDHCDKTDLTKRVIECEMSTIDRFPDLDLDFHSGNLESYERKNVVYSRDSL